MDDRPKVRPELIRRFELIEWRVFWQGRVNRNELEDRFKISAAQASADLKAYEDAAPGNIRYDNGEKAFLPTRTFKPKYLAVSADRYLAQLNAIQNTVVDASDTWFGSAPAAAVMPAWHSVDPNVLQRMLEAIRKVGAVNVEYQSLTNTRMRKIAPHALAFDGHRWHVRAWCLERTGFRDFVLTRMSSVGEVEEFESNAMKDTEWHEMIDLKIVPHPLLSPPQQEAIARDFGMKNGARVFSMRIALAFYVIKRLNLDLDLPPERKQIELANKDEVEQRQRDALARTKQLLEVG
ncbi:MAG: WYL domain-containing protein [Reyranella sp.]|nr:WYL domain-containing protein [Reyranella sp.]